MPPADPWCVSLGCRHLVVSRFLCVWRHRGPRCRAALSLASVRPEEFFIPNQHVGRVIGKSGETINRLQDESKCRIQIAPDMGGMGPRPATLTGTPEQIA